MLTDGIDHPATITHDADRLRDFYVAVFDATIEHDGPEFDGGPRMVIANIGDASELNIFELPDNPHATRVRPMFGRGKIDHLGFRAADADAFASIRQRLIDRGATDGTVTDFGRKLSLFFRDPDGMECEVLIPAADVDTTAAPYTPHPPRP